FHFAQAPAEARPKSAADARPGVRGAERALERLLVVLEELRLLIQKLAALFDVGRNRVIHPPRERIDEAIAHLPQRCEALGLGLTDVGRDDDDRLARAPFRAGDRIVVLRLDANLHRCVALLDERIGRAEVVAAAIHLGLAVEPREHATLLAHA